MSILRWWRLRRHDRRDINCIHWDLTWAGEPAVCARCRADGGYAERRRAQVAAERAQRPVQYVDFDPSAYDEDGDDS